MKHSVDFRSIGSANTYGFCQTIRRLCPHVGALLLFSSAGIAVAADRAASASAFEIIRGAGTAVCDAYAAQLNSMEFETDPYCDRTFGFEHVPFVSPEHAPLSGQEILRLYAPVVGFLGFDDPAYFDTHLRSGVDQEARQMAQPRDWEPASSGSILGKSSHSPIFRFAPPVDIDNDGITDDLIGWRPNFSGSCGGVFSGDPNPRRGPTFLVFLDSKGMPDVLRTRAVFGHPAGKVLSHLDAAGKPRTTTVPGFRSIGGSFDVFRYRDEYFFNTFYDSKGDLNGERGNNPALLADTIAVLKRKDGNNSLMCEIRWKRPKFE